MTMQDTEKIDEVTGCERMSDAKPASKPAPVTNTNERTYSALRLPWLDQSHANRLAGNVASSQVNILRAVTTTKKDLVKKAKNKIKLRQSPSGKMTIAKVMTLFPCNLV